MSTWKTNLQKAGKTLFCFTLLVGIVMFLWCFIRCPDNLSKLYGHTEVNYKYVLYFLSAFALWVLLLACCCCLWRDSAVFLWWHRYQRNHETDNISNKDSMKDNVNKKSKECCKSQAHEDIPNSNVTTMTYINEMQLEVTNVCSKV
jgi:ABC-type nickel/cobalt efflux system permease component RcnA